MKKGIQTEGHVTSSFFECPEARGVERIKLKILPENFMNCAYQEGPHFVPLVGCLNQCSRLYVS